jgi:hypothetical protein
LICSTPSCYCVERCITVGDCSLDSRLKVIEMPISCYRFEHLHSATLVQIPFTHTFCYSTGARIVLLNKRWHRNQANLACVANTTSFLASLFWVLCSVDETAWGFWYVCNLVSLFASSLVCLCCVSARGSLLMGRHSAHTFICLFVFFCPPAVLPTALDRAYTRCVCVRAQDPLCM